MTEDQKTLAISIDDLILEYGRLEFLEKANKKQKVTRQLINRSKTKLISATVFFHLLGIIVIFIGAIGIRKSSPTELTFLIPIGLVITLAIHRHYKKSNMALKALAKLSIHRL